MWRLLFISGVCLIRYFPPFVCDEIRLGHTKSLCALVGKLVRVQSVTITLFVGVPLLEKAEKELAKYFLPEGEDYLKDSIRLGQRFKMKNFETHSSRIVGIPVEAFTVEIGPIQSELLKGYKTLFSEEPIRCGPNSDYFHPVVRKPQLVLLDVGNVRLTSNSPISLPSTSSSSSAMKRYKG